jgi:hypothetical protein
MDLYGNENYFSQRLQLAHVCIQGCCERDFEENEIKFISEIAWVVCCSA